MGLLAGTRVYLAGCAEHDPNAASWRHDLTRHLGELEIVVYRARGHPGPLGDLGRLGVVVPLLGDDLDGGFEDQFSYVFRFFLCHADPFVMNDRPFISKQAKKSPADLAKVRSRFGGTPREDSLAAEKGSARC